MRYIFVLDMNKTIQGYCPASPEDNASIEVTTEELNQIHIGYSQVINNHIILNNELFEKEQLHQQTLQKINQLKAQLAATDYMAFKYLEGQLSEEKFNEVKAQRQEWRDQINELEKNYE